MEDSVARVRVVSGDRAAVDVVSSPGESLFDTLLACEVPIAFGCAGTGS
jgi:hypothetical protein